MPSLGKNHSASMLLAGAKGGEVRKILDIRVAFDPSVLEKERVVVDRAPVNNDHNSELGQSARHAGTVALKLLFREINHNDPVSRLWIDIEPPTMAVTGRSAELLFGLATYLHIASATLPGGVPDSHYMATGSLDADGNVGSVDAVAIKVRAALATDPKKGTKLFYPRADEGQIDDELRGECRDAGLLLIPVDRIDEALDSLGVPILGSWPSGLSPFRALEAYDTSFSRVFFGRQREVAALMSLLEARAAAGRPGAIIIGASGAGKSSFCLAGMLPALIKQNPGLHYSVWRPRDAVSGLGDEPATDQRLAKSIISQWQVRDDKQSGMLLTQRLPNEPSLADLPGGLAPMAGHRTIFVVDQFEELFTLKFTPEARIGFARLLQSLQANGVWVIGTLRSEFYAHYLELCDEDSEPVLTPLFEGDGQYNLPRMSRDAFSQVITRPAELAGLVFEQRADGIPLSQKLLADAMATDDALPLLGFALQKLYDEMERPAPTGKPDDDFPRTLGFAAYERLGGLAGAIGSVAEQAFAKLDMDAQAELPSLLNALAVPSTDGTRETARPAPIEQWPLSSPSRRLIDALIAIRVLVSEEGAAPGASAQVRVSHEALFSHWDQATEILHGSRQSRLLIEDFRQRARIWDGDGRRKDALLSSPRDIENGRAVLPFVPAGGGNEPVIAFVETSIGHARSRRQIWYASAAVIALALSGTTGWALLSAQQARTAETSAKQSADRERDARKYAEDQAFYAREAERVAGLGRELAIHAQTQAEKAAKAEKLAKLQAQAAAVAERQQRAEALRQRDLAFAATRVATEQRKLAAAQTEEVKRERSLAFAKLAEQAIEGGDAMTGILIARSQLQPGDEAHWTGGAQAALLKGLLANQEKKILRIGGDSFASRSRSLSFDGQRVVTFFGDQAQVWSLAEGESTSVALAGHTSGIRSAVFSPDGRRVATASSDNTARVWTLDGDRATSLVLVGHTAGVNSAVFSPDGRRVATASEDGTTRVWTLDGDSATSVVLSGHTGAVDSAEFSPDGKRVVTRSTGAGKLGESDSVGHSALVWTLEDDNATSVALAGHTSMITSAVFSPDGRRVVTASVDGTARVWTLSGDRATSVLLAGHTGSVNSAAFSPDGLRVITASDDNTAKLWTLDGNSTTSVVLAGHTERINYAAFSPDGRRVVTVSSDDTARIWMLDGERITSTVLAGHEAGVDSAAFNSDSRSVSTVSNDSTARVWTLDGNSATSLVLARPSERLTNAVISPDGRRVVTASVDGSARVWTLDGDSETSVVLAGHTSMITSAVFSPDGQRVTTASIDGTARVWTLDGDRAASEVLAGHTSMITSAVFSPDGRRVVTASVDGTARVWTLSGDRATSVLLAGHTGSVNSAAFSPDGLRVITASDDKTARVWTLDGDRATSLVLVGHTAKLDSAVFSPDGLRVVTASRDGTARLWTLEGESITSVVLAGHTAWLNSAVFSLDGQRLVTASNDGTARVWTLDGDRATSLVLAGHTGPVDSAAFSPDGKRVVTLSVDAGKLDGSESGDDRIRVWTLDGDRATSMVLAGHTATINSAVFSPDGQRLVTASYDGTARVWHIPFGSELLQLSDRVITRCLTTQQLERFGLSLSPRASAPPCR